VLSVAAPLRRRSYRALLIGQGVSALGDWLATFTFMALALRETGSPTAVGGILALRLLPALLGGPLAARIAARYDRRRTMVAMDLARAGIIAVVPLVSGLWWLYVAAFAVEVCSLVALPARDSSIPDLVDPDSLPVANGMMLGSSFGTIPLGAAVFALIAALPSPVRPYSIAFWVDALTYLVSAALIATLTELNRPAHQPTEGEDERPLRIRDALSIPLVRAILPATAAVAVGLGALFSLGIVLVRDVLHAGDAEFGALIACFGVGAVVGLGALQRFGARNPLDATRMGAFLLGVIVAVFSLAPTIAFAFVGAIAFGAAAAWTLASGMGVLQSSLYGNARIVAFAAFHVVIRSGLAVAAIGAGVAGQLVGSVSWPVVGRLEPSRVVLLCSGILVMLSALRVHVRSVRARMGELA
jgi:predicted MFS family arabinose efflux permease